jgi:S1-C subfamily serine protease
VALTSVVQTSAAINPGDSGGALKKIAGQLASRGRVVASGRASLGVELRSLPTGAIKRVWLPSDLR